MAATRPQRAVGIVRVSSTRERETTILSPDQQRDRVHGACAERGLELVDVVEELDVSGGTPLVRRKGLRRAIEAVEAGEADVIVAAYFDRLCRSLRVQDELVSRVEAAGGQVLALDTGQITNGSAGQWLSSTLLGAVSEYARRTTAERVADSHRTAIAAGIPPYPFSTAGYVQRKDRTIAVDPATAPAVREAFRLRAAGATISTVREQLQAAGVTISYRATQTLLASRAVLGELHFGSFQANRAAWDPIVAPEVWEAVQEVRVPQGRKAKTERLLSRLGVVRCGGCGRPMVAGSSIADGRRYENYRCPQSDHDCPDRQVISSRIVERVVWRIVCAALDDAEGQASALSQARLDAVDAERADAELQRTLETFQAAGVEVEAAALGRLKGLREARDVARRRASRSAAQAGTKQISIGKDRDALTLEERRALVQVVVGAVVVAPGRGEGRLTVELVG